MLSLAGLVIIAIVIAVALAARGRTPGKRGQRVADAIDQSAAAGVLTPEQADSLRAYEQAPTSGAEPAIARPATPRPARRVPVAAEALGYLGGVLALVGLVLVVARYWPDMATAARLGLRSVGAVMFFGAGALVNESADPALTRLRGFLWLLATAALALFVGLLAVDGFGVTTNETVVLMCAGVVAVASTLMWARARTAVAAIDVPWCRRGVGWCAHCRGCRFGAGGIDDFGGWRVVSRARAPTTDAAAVAR
jgi:hypothetical protein